MTRSTLCQPADTSGLPTTPASGASQMNFAVALTGNAQLLRPHFYLQAFSLAPGANSPAILSSNGVDYRVGNQRRGEAADLSVSRAGRSPSGSAEQGDA